MSKTIESLAGSTILITGAAMGMGKMYARLAVEDHASHVILWDVNAELLEADRPRAGGQGLRNPHPGGGRQQARGHRARRRADQGSEAGSPDILINNAGIVRGKYFWEHDQRADIAATMNINTLALMHITREFLPAMIERGRTSRIVNVASAAGLLANPRMSIYSSSKWAVVGWSDSLRLELDPGRPPARRRDDLLPVLHQDRHVRGGPRAAADPAAGTGGGDPARLAGHEGGHTHAHDAVDGEAEHRPARGAAAGGLGRGGRARVRRLQVDGAFHRPQVGEPGGP